VLTTLRLKCRQHSDEEDLVLDGTGVELLSIHVQGFPLLPDAYVVTSSTLTIRRAALPVGSTTFVMGTVVQINPQTNTRLEGLYRLSFHL